MIFLFFIFLLFTSSANAQTWVKVDTIGNGHYPIEAGNEKNTGPYRPDISVLPPQRKLPDECSDSANKYSTKCAPIERLSGTRTTDGKFLIQVGEDLSKVTPSAEWTKPTKLQVRDELFLKGLDVDKVKSLPKIDVIDVIKDSLLRWILPAIAWALDFADSFDRGDARPLNGSWVNFCIYSAYCPDPETLLAITGNHVVGYPGAAFTYSMINAYTSSSNQEAQVTMTIASSFCASIPMTCFPGVVLRADGAGNFYGVLVDGENGYSEITVFYPDSSSTIAQDFTTPWVTSDVIKFRAVGSALSVYRNGGGVATMTASDATFTTGQPGMIIGNFLGDTGAVQLDDFSSADVAAAAGVAARRREIRY